MASIDNLSVELVDRQAAAQSATLRIRYRVRLNDLERDMAGLKFREKIQLFGAFCLGDEDFLYELAPQSFAAHPNGLVQRERLVTVADDFMDEPSDDLYAKVWITPRLPEPCVAESPGLVLSF